MSTASHKVEQERSRRKFLKFLSLSPLLGFELTSCLNREDLPATATSQPTLESSTIATPDQALNVFDFEAVARKNLPPAHFGYIATGVDDDYTLRENENALKRIKLRMRRLTGIDKVDTSMELFGETWETPIILAPAASQKAFHPEGEIAVARAAKTQKHLQVLSTGATSSIEEVVEARGAPVWFQLYPPPDWGFVQGMLNRAEVSGSPVVVLTVDQVAGSNRETLSRFKQIDTRNCKSCHQVGVARYDRIPFLKGLDYKDDRSLSWDFIQKLKTHTSMKIVIKGIVTYEDALLCVENGVDGIIVSNHGGRASESGRGSIECLPEVVRAVDGKFPVLIDGGFRRGTDVFKAIALGADAVCIGRPYLWGLAAFGQSGVETVLKIMRRELQLVMAQAGTPTLKNINGNYVT